MAEINLTTSRATVAPGTGPGLGPDLVGFVPWIWLDQARIVGIVNLATSRLALVGGLVRSRGDLLYAKEIEEKAMGLRQCARYRRN